MTDLTVLPGVGDGTAQKLRDGGILTIMGVAVNTPGQIKDAAGITEAAARKLINAARELCELGFEKGDVVAEKQNTTEFIPTYCTTIDALLGGGLKLGTTMEAFGQYASGKTQLGHMLAVSTLQKFPDSYVIWIDTENTFSAKRIVELCAGLDLDSDKVLSHIKVGKAVSSDHQILLTEHIEKDIVEGDDVKLIVVDSMMNHFRAEYLGRGTLAGRQQMINGYLHKIASLVSSYGMSVYMTNQVQHDPGQLFGNPEKAVGGNIIGHFATTRVWIIKAAKNSRKMKLVDSPDMPVGEAVFMIKSDKLEGVE